MISVIVPLLNEAESIVELHRQLLAAENACGDELQIIMVDDGSTDQSWELIERIAVEDKRVLGIRFRKNFGKAAALSAGFDVAQGEVIVTIDGDLQDDPAEIPKLLDKLHKGSDVVSGWKTPRHDPWHKVWPSWVFNGLVSRLMGVQLHDHNCGLKAFRRDVMHEIRLYGELHRFVPVLADARGFSVGEVPIKHRPRQFGKSKYGAERFGKALLDLLTVKFITGYGDRPQHLLGMVGLIAFMFGGLGMCWLAARWCLSRVINDWEVVHLHQTAALYYSLGLFLVGSQFLSVGLLGEMITAHLSRDRDAFSIAEYTSDKQSSTSESSSTHKVQA